MAVKGVEEDQCLKYVAGVDVSYSKDDPSIACAALVVLNLRTLEVVHEEYSIANLRTPYIPGFLAFREAPILLEVLEKLKSDANPYYPQLLMVDGNGLLHPRGFGLACHLGVLADLPAIGIGKNLHHVEGLTQLGVRQLLEAKQSCTKDIITLTGSTGQTLGVVRNFLILSFEKYLKEVSLEHFPLFLKNEFGPLELLLTRRETLQQTPVLKVPDQGRSSLQWGEGEKFEHPLPNWLLLRSHN